ncbi:MAG: DUF1311 domain-containing protein [Flavobacteriales bacterium]|nr:DUF1311 domain-containing protein [Flavobacteriales bacterium]
MMHSGTYGQSTALRPVTLMIGNDTVQVGCDTAQVLDRTNLALLTNVAHTEEQLMADLISSMQPSGGSKSDVKDIKKEQKLWMKARDRHCAEEVKGLPPDRKEVARMSCIEWAHRCRLVELLAAYDRVVPPVK